MDKKERCFKGAINAYRKSNDDKWVSAFWCAQVVGNYDRGATLGLASDMSVSSDTVEDLAHSYQLYYELCGFDCGSFRKFVRSSRRQPFVYYSHFRALHDAKNKYDLSVLQILDLLMTIVQAEGGISSRDIDNHARQRYGKETDWTWDASQVQKKLNKLIQRPDLPTDGRHKASELYNWIGENVK